VPVIDLVDPSLVILVGPAGAGKSTFAARHFDAGEVLSSDAFRAAISGDEADQRVTRAAFAALHRTLERRLADRLTTVVDATNLGADARRALRTRARSAAVSTTAIVLDLPPTAVVARNRARTGRVVDDAVVRRHLDRLRSVLDGPGRTIHDEGFDQVIVLRGDAAVAGVTISRRPPG
jgi:protein phosphatase